MQEVEFAGPVDLARTMSVFRRGTGDPTYQVDGALHWRAMRLASGPVSFCWRQSAPDRAEVDAWGEGADELYESFAGWFPDDGFASAELPHPVIKDAQRRFPGVRTPRTGRALESLIPAIIEQRVVGRDAFAAWRRLVRRFGTPAPSPTPRGLYVPPSTSGWAALAAWDWHIAGVDPRRYRAAQAAARVGDRLDALATAGDLAAIYRALRSVAGVGAWTAGEVGARALGDADAVSWGDYHLANTVGVGLTGQRVTDDDVPDLLEPFRPYRGRVVRLLELSPLVTVERRGPRMSRVDHRRI